MTKASIISCIIHLIILLVVTNLNRVEVPKISNLGENIEVRMISKDRGRPQDALKGSGAEEKKAEEKQQENKEIVQKKPVKTFEGEKKQELAEKIPLPKEKEVEKKIQIAEAPKEKAVKIKSEPKESPQEKAAEKTVEEVDKLQETEESTDIAVDKKSQKENSQGEKVVVNTNSVSETKGTKGEELGENLIKLSDGSYMAKHQGIKGLNYGFVSNPEPSYPSLAKRLGFKGDMTVKVIMEFGSDGKLEDIKLVGDRDRFGFTNEVEKTVKNWRLTGVRYNDTAVKMRFYKSFKFQEPS